jgi:hypothetical protein
VSETLNHLHAAGRRGQAGCMPLAHAGRPAGGRMLATILLGVKKKRQGQICHFKSKYMYFSCKSD